MPTAGTAPLGNGQVTQSSDLQTATDGRCEPRAAAQKTCCGKKSSCRKEVICSGSGSPFRPATDTQARTRTPPRPGSSRLDSRGPPTSSPPTLDEAREPSLTSRMGQLILLTMVLQFQMRPTAVGAPRLMLDDRERSPELRPELCGREVSAQAAERVVERGTQGPILFQS